MKRIFGLLVAGVVLCLATPAKAGDSVVLMKKLLTAQHLDFYVKAMSDNDMRMVINASCQMLDEGKTPKEINDYFLETLRGDRYLVAVSGLLASTEMCPAYTKIVTEWAER